VRAEILKNHTLLASISLPNDLFHPVGVITCAMVFEAHQPHEDSPSPTWFATWKNDGFIKLKKRGRVDLRGTWPEIRDGWLKSFHARASVPGQSIVREVDENDEWCAEAYLETNYNALTRQDFAALVREYAIFDAVTATESQGDEDDEADQ
jgi:type I restriction-modification system DNA methylase subunit